MAEKYPNAPIFATRVTGPLNRDFVWLAYLQLVRMLRTTQRKQICAPQNIEIASTNEFEQFRNPNPPLTSTFPKNVNQVDRTKLDEMKKWTCRSKALFKPERYIEPHLQMMPFDGRKYPNAPIFATRMADPLNRDFVRLAYLQLVRVLHTTLRCNHSTGHVG